MFDSKRGAPPTARAAIAVVALTLATFVTVAVPVAAAEDPVTPDAPSASTTTTTVASGDDADPAAAVLALQPNEAVVFIRLKTQTGQFNSCHITYGTVGTQICNGSYVFNNLTSPRISWPFCCSAPATTKAGKAAGHDDMTIQFFAPGGFMEGTVPSEASPRYHVTGGRIGSNDMLSFPDNPAIAAGELGGPLSLNVTGSCAPVQCRYEFEVHGYLLLTFLPGLGAEPPAADPAVAVEDDPSFTG